MRRKEKAITDRNEIDAFIKKAQICRLAFAVDGQPYLVPMNFGYDGAFLYFHCAKEGRKLEMLRENPRVCFEMEVDSRLVRGETACRWTMDFISLIGFGTGELVAEPEEKVKGLGWIMKQYAPEETFEISLQSVQSVAILKVSVDEITGKKSGY